MSSIEDFARRFDADRRHLRSVAFHLLGSVADAEDAVQSAWLKASRADRDRVENLTGWFTTITAREAFDQLRARNRRAEQPLADSDQIERGAEASSAGADEDAVLADSVSRALLVVLDRLSPAQRIAFVLHDVFATPFDTIGELLDRSPDAAKKLVAEETRRFALRSRAGVVVLINGVPGVVIAPAGRVHALLQIGIDGGSIHTTDYRRRCQPYSRGAQLLEPGGAPRLKVLCAMSRSGGGRYCLAPARLGRGRWRRGLRGVLPMTMR